MASPAPDVAEPERRQHMDRRGNRAVIGHGDAPQHVFRRAFRDFLGDIEVSAFVKNAHVREFQLRTFPSEPLIFHPDRGVGKRRMWIFVEDAGVGMGRRGIEIVITFLHVLAVIALVSAEPEKPFFENRVISVPKRGGETKVAVAVRPAIQAVLAPAVGAAAGVVMREIRPAIAVFRVVFANRAPLALAQIRAPMFPVFLAGGIFVESFVFPGHQKWSKQLPCRSGKRVNRIDRKGQASTRPPTRKKRKSKG